MQDDSNLQGAQTMRGAGLGIYVHFPWCLRHCPYCDFTVAVTSRPIPEALYAAAVLAELEVRARAFGGRSPALSVYFGGGTPGLWGAEHIGAIIEGIARRIGLVDGAEITVECNPEDLDLSRTRALVAVGVNRVSLGVQAFDDDSLGRLGRAHRRVDIERSVDAIGAAGLSNFSIDLMHGLAGQTVAQAVDDVGTALALGAPHLSTYQLTIEHKTVFGARKARGESLLEPDGPLLEMYEQIRARLEAGGCPHYEISNAARPGFEAVHNTLYWREGECLALGAGAHGCWREGAKVERWANIRHAGRYMRAALEGAPGELFRERLTVEEQLVERVMTGLRTALGVRIDTRLDVRFGRNASALEARGLLRSADGHWRVTREGRGILDTVLVALTQD